VAPASAAYLIPSGRCASIASVQDPVNSARVGASARAVVAVIAACALFGTTGTVLQRGPAGTTTLGVGAARLLVGGATLALVARIDRPAGGRRWRRFGRTALLGGAMVAVYQLSFFYATRHAGVALGTVCTIASGPIFAGVIAWIRSRHVPTRTWTLGTVLCIVGVVLLVVVGRDGGDVEASGIGAALLSGLGYAAYASVAKHQMERGLDPAASMASLFATAGILTSPLLLIEPMGWLTSARGSLMLAHLGIVTVGVAYTLYGRGLRHLPTPTVVTLTLVEPVTAALLSVVVLDEPLAAAGWVGIVVVLAGLLVASRPEPAPLLDEPQDTVLA
jgi:drug/metabolite transporter, DME family